MKPVLYIFANRGLGMSHGKMAAQVGHAVSKAVRFSEKKSRSRSFVSPDLLGPWDEGAHETKLVMLAEDETHLQNIQKYIEERGFTTFPVIDEGRTEVRPHSFTALGVEIVDKDNSHTAATFESFKTYRNDDKIPDTGRIEGGSGRWFRK